MGRQALARVPIKARNLISCGTRRREIFSMSEQIFISEKICMLMKIVLSRHRSRLTADNFKACVQLKVTNY